MNLKLYCEGKDVIVYYFFSAHFHFVPSTALAASEEKSNEEVECKGETQEAISWYNRVLGFHVEGGPGN